MSHGIVICSKCKRELHQDGGWFHCEDDTPRCDYGSSEYVENPNDIKGKWCGRDE